MTQQPNISKRTNSKVTEMNTSVPRSQGNLSNNTITTIDEEIFSIPSPDSGYALKLIKEFQPLWSQHYKKNLITKVLSLITRNKTDREDSGQYIHALSPGPPRANTIYLLLSNK